jgi:hypothetical protein
MQELGRQDKKQGTAAGAGPGVEGAQEAQGAQDIFFSPYTDI